MRTCEGSADPDFLKAKGLWSSATYSAVAAILVAGCGGGGGPSGASGTPYVVLHSFATSASDGAIPLYSSLTLATDGNFYGTTSGGGTNGWGTVFRITTSGAETVLHSFDPSQGDGAIPKGSLIQASDGNFYGMTSLGGAKGRGTVFKVTASGMVSVLYSFTGGPSDGGTPLGNLIQASDGNLYGMTFAGGSTAVNGSPGNGTVFKVTTNGAMAVLYSFTGGPSDGGSPQGSLVQASDGNLYGMTPGGGANGYGTVFRVTTSGAITVLHSFAGGPSDGWGPTGSLIQASDGNLYGTTPGGGANNRGTVFKITTSGAETVLHSFVRGGAIDGGGPQGNLIQASDGNLYGMVLAGGSTAVNGSDGYGAVFKMTTSGTETVLHSFGGPPSDGGSPQGSLVQASDGSLYGMTTSGGATNYGTVFRIAP